MILMVGTIRCYEPQFFNIISQPKTKIIHSSSYYIMIYLVLLFMLPCNNESFSSTPPPLPRAPLRMPTSPSLLHAATLDDSESSLPSTDATIMPEILHEKLSSTTNIDDANTPVESPSAVAKTASSLNSTMPATNSILETRSLDHLANLDKNTIINTSILLFATILVLEQILSVNVGITRGWTPTEIAERIPLDNWRSYTDILNMAPLQTKAVTSATVYTIGDIIAQNTEGKDIGKLDLWRVVRSLLAGFVGHGPMSHVWYHVSEDFFDTVLKLHAWWDFVPKVVVDQLIWGPFWNNTYILLLGLMQLQKPSQIWDDVKRTTIPLIISGLKLWPFVHCITYGLIPVENRLLWVDAVEIIWVTILASEASGGTE
mmetsp:Transcript_34585/g.74757  ORF Transcript_34585/g.74757 Transcript_34585/m.74757 type:complete len:373 (+) Transcript_34585:192-1310(+)